LVAYEVCRLQHSFSQLLHVRVWPRRRRRLARALAFHPDELAVSTLAFLQQSHAAFRATWGYSNSC
jgi:hypothetical protein